MMATARICAYAAAALALAWLALAPAPAAALQCGAGTFAFYPGGGIKSCRIEAYHQFWTRKGERLVCAPGHPVTQYEDGAVESCTTDAPHTFDATACGPGRVTFEADGTLRDCGR